MVSPGQIEHRNVFEMSHCHSRIVVLVDEISWREKDLGLLLKCGEDTMFFLRSNLSEYKVLLMGMYWMTRLETIPEKR